MSATLDNLRHHSKAWSCSKSLVLLLGRWMGGLLVQRPHFPIVVPNFCFINLAATFFQYIEHYIKGCIDRALKRLLWVFRHHQFFSFHSSKNCFSQRFTVVCFRQVDVRCRPFKRLPCCFQVYIAAYHDDLICRALLQPHQYTILVPSNGCFNSVIVMESFFYLQRYIHTYIHTYIHLSWFSRRWLQKLKFSC